MDLVIDVGNSETVLGLVGRGAEPEIVSHWRFSTGVPRTADEYELLLRSLLERGGHESDAIGRAVVGSVVPAVTAVLDDALSRLVTEQTWIVSGDEQLPIRLDVDEPKTVGADRIANTLAAMHMYGRDTIAVDLGTATTFDCITGDGSFVGGVISQGIQAGLDWLGRKTAKLPTVELEPPERVIGRRTEACIQSGVFYSAVDAVDGLVRRIREEWERPDALVVATGGYSEVIGPFCTTVDKIEPLLTLYGLALAGRYFAGEA